MDPRAAARMFHVLVVMGASLGGCTMRPVGETEGGGATGTTGTTGGKGSSTSTTTGASATGTSTVADTSTSSAPTTGSPTTGAVETSAGSTTGPVDGPEDCEHPQDLHCASYSPNVDCYCDPDSPLVPEDCDHPQQFICEAWWIDAGCSCDPDAPLVPEDCPVPSSFHCSEYNPEFVSCSCECYWGPPSPQGDADCMDWGPYWCDYEPYACCCHIMLG